MLGGTIHTFFALWLIDKFKAGMPITEWRFGGKLTPANVQFLLFLLEGELQGFKGCAVVGGVAPRLVLRHPTWTPVIVFGPEHGVWDVVWAELGGHREREFTVVRLETPFVHSAGKLLDGNAVVGEQAWVQVVIQVLESVLSCLGCVWKLRVEVVGALSIKSFDLFA